MEYQQIINLLADIAPDIDLVMPMYKLIEYSDIYSKTSGSLWQYHRDEPDLNNAGDITNFPFINKNIISFKFKEKIAGQTGNDSTKDVEIMISLKYVNNFCRTLECH